MDINSKRVRLYRLVITRTVYFASLHPLSAAPSVLTLTAVFASVTHLAETLYSGGSTGSRAVITYTPGCIVRVESSPAGGAHAAVLCYNYKGILYCYDLNVKNVYIIIYLKRMERLGSLFSFSTRTDTSNSF